MDMELESVVGKSVCPNELLGGRSKGKEILIEDEKLEIGEMSGAECTDIDSGSDFKRFSEPYFLRRVLCEETGHDLSVTKLVFLAIHAVFLDSGFVGFDSISGLRVDIFDILKQQTSITFTTTVSYTLPELFSDDNGTESIVLKLQSLGYYVNVYASLAIGHLGLCKLSIDKSRFVPAIGQIWATGGSQEMDASIADAEKIIFEFWKLVKDGLAIPLMIDLCEKTGLNLPPCFIRLPAEIKSRILELLPGQDVARVACVCKEMRYLSSNNELWKEKYMSEFGSSTVARAPAGHAGIWKALFVIIGENAKKMARGRYTGNYLPTFYKSEMFLRYAFEAARAVAEGNPNLGVFNA